MRKYILFAGLILFFSSFLFAQEQQNDISLKTLSWKLGLDGGFVVYGFPSGTLNSYGYKFENLNGYGFYLNAVGSMPLDYKSDLLFGLGSQSLTIFSTKERGRYSSVVGEPNPVLVNMESQVDIDISSLYLTASYKRKFGDGFSILGGLDMHIITDCKIKQDETIKDDRFEFIGSGKTDLIYEGDLKDHKNFQLNLKVGFGYDFVVDYKYLITPIMSFSYPLLKLTSSNSARVMLLTVGINILYIF